MSLLCCFSLLLLLYNIYIVQEIKCQNPLQIFMKFVLNVAMDKLNFIVRGEIFWDIGGQKLEKKDIMVFEVSWLFCS